MIVIITSNSNVLSLKISLKLLILKIGDKVDSLLLMAIRNFALCVCWLLNFHGLP